MNENYLKDALRYFLTLTPRLEGQCLDILTFFLVSAEGKGFIKTEQEGREWLTKYGGTEAIFQAIAIVEKDEEVKDSTDFSSPHSLSNMLIYALGKGVLSEISVIKDQNDDERITSSVICLITDEVNRLL